LGQLVRAFLEILMDYILIGVGVLNLIVTIAVWRMLAARLAKEEAREALALKHQTHEGDTSQPYRITA
jgi:hypothetical protein